MASAGDVNGDGIDDLIIGAWRADPNGNSSAGASYVVFGKRDGFDASFDLASLATGDGSTGFVISGAKEGSQSGHSVAGVGDLNKDGYDDLIIGAKAVGEPDAAGTTEVGESYVIYGQKSYDSGVMHLASMLGIRSFVSTPENNTDTIYTAAATDIDGDDADIIYSLGSGNDEGFFQIDASTGALSFKAAPDYENPGDADGNNAYIVEIIAKDFGNLETSQTLVVTVTNVNEAPVAWNDTILVYQNGPWDIDVAELLANDNDPDSDLLTITAVDNAVGGTAVLNEGEGDTSIRFTPSPDINVGDVIGFEYSISDGNGGTATAYAELDWS